MNTPDDFSRYHAELLDGIYDCVDRIVLNAFFSMGQTGGGMRTAARSWTSYLSCSNACARCSSASSVRCRQRTLRSWTKAPLSVGAHQHNAAPGDWRALTSIKLATVMWSMRWWRSPRGLAASPWRRWQKPFSSAQVLLPKATPH